MKDDILEQSIAQKTLKSVMDHYGFTVPMILNRIGLKYSDRLYDISRGKTKVMSKAVINAIKSIWPELNDGYLRTGRGDMFVAPPVEEKKEDFFANDMPGVLLHLVNVIEQQAQQITELTKEVKNLKLYVAASQRLPINFDLDIDAPGRKASDNSTCEPTK